MGSIEQHGPQTPVGDYRYMTEVSRRIAEKCNAIVLPTIPWGYSEYFRNYPGCLTIAPETLKAILKDLLDCLMRQGLDRFVFVCGHKGNMPIIEQVARDLIERHKIRPATIEPIGWLDRKFLAECYGTEDFKVGHGSDPMSSIALYLFPDDTREDLLEAGTTAPKFAGLPIQGMSGADFQGIPVSIYVDTEDLAPNGVLGNPYMANQETGRRCVERMVDFGARFVDWFSQQDTAVTPVKPSYERANS